MTSVLNFGCGCFFFYSKIANFVYYEWYKQD